MRISEVSYRYEVPFTSSETSDKRKKNAEGAVIGTGAAAGAAKKAGFNMFKSTNKLGAITRETRDVIKIAQEPVQNTKNLFGNFGRTAKIYTQKLVQWSENFKKTPFMKSLLENRLAMGITSCFGFGLAALTLITGMANIAKATSFAVEKHVSKSEFLNSLNDDEE